ncbi:DUF3102 domain-containing protein [Methylobacterium fujisawaense]|uniref:DUF3102 domain-containing protein n=1 Tax=Methylobacterium fujisawaense TaxID=107400 RepID=UPI00344B6802
MAALVRHGNFLPWIEAEFSMGERTARNFMQAAEAYGKSAMVADLPATVLYALASPSTPEPIREEFMREAEAAGGATAEQIAKAMRVCPGHGPGCAGATSPMAGVSSQTRPGPTGSGLFREDRACRRGWQPS